MVIISQGSQKSHLSHKTMVNLMVAHPINDQFGYPQFHPVPSSFRDQGIPAAPAQATCILQLGRALGARKTPAVTEPSSFFVFQQQQRPVRKNDLRRKVDSSRITGRNTSWFLT